MANRGQLKYVPADTLAEWDAIRQQLKVKDSEAFRVMAEFSRVGREIDELMNRKRRDRF